MHYDPSMNFLPSSRFFRSTLLACMLPLGGLAGEVLYNGIQLPAEWPPRGQKPENLEPMPVPYLESPPAVIPIDVGRQLFVDDFLIASTTLVRSYHQPEKYQGNPILFPQTERELNGGVRPAAVPHSGGAWYDHRDGLFKMWYMTGWYGGLAVAHSRDGLVWTRPDLGVIPGTNAYPDPSPDLRYGMDHVRIDWMAQDENERFKSLHYYHAKPGDAQPPGGRLHVSRDGYHWSKPIAATGPSGDRNTFFYNPFRQVWVFSSKVQPIDHGPRSRGYWEGRDFVSAAQWPATGPVYWFGADRLDQPDATIGDPPQIYDMDAIAYESLMVGIFQVHKGPHNSLAAKNRLPKMTELNIGFTRDGFHWHRPVRSPFIAATRTPGNWERAYLHATGGVMLVVGDRLFFYYNGFSGETPKGPNMYGGGSTGVAFLRRDGFASMDAGREVGQLTTRPLRFSGKHLFVNLDAPEGGLRAEILDESGQPLPGFTLDQCVPLLSVDSTRRKLEWRGTADLSGLAGRNVRIRFELKQGRLYSFWVSPDSEGHSRGYVAAGGPEFRGPVDSPTGF
jgi:hypothetical protein